VTQRAGSALSKCARMAVFPRSTRKQKIKIKTFFSPSFIKKGRCAVGTAGQIYYRYYKALLVVPSVICYIVLIKDLKHYIIPVLESCILLVIRLY
jgi:hypothetical protein